MDFPTLIADRQTFIESNDGFQTFLDEGLLLGLH